MNSPGFRRTLERLGTHSFEIQGKKKTPLQKVERGYPKNRLHLLFNGANKDDNYKSYVAQRQRIYNTAKTIAAKDR